MPNICSGNTGYNSPMSPKYPKPVRHAEPNFETYSISIEAGSCNDKITLNNLRFDIYISKTDSYEIWVKYRNVWFLLPADTLALQHFIDKPVS